MGDFNNDGPVQNFIRIGTSEIATPAIPSTPIPAPVPQPVQIVPAATYAAPVYTAPPPLPVAQPLTAPVGSVVITDGINLPADTSNFYSTTQSYFALASQQINADTWYEYPTQTGTVIFDPVGGGPSKNLTATGEVMAYDGQSLMPSTWYLNPSLNGEILLVDASGTQLLHSIDSNLYYNNELLAKANDIQNIADWSLYPALASVDFDSNSITGLTDIVAVGAASVGSLTVTGTLDNPVGGFIASGINTNTSGILTSGLSTNPGVAATTDSVTTSQILFDICGGTLATDGGGTILTFNGQAITTGTEGDAANWSSYPAFNDITGVTTEPLVIRAPGSQPLNIIANNNAINSTTGGAYNVTVDKGTNILAAANVNITAQNGDGGSIQLNAQPGYQLGPEQVGFGAIQLNAYGSSNQALGLGGKIDITAYSGGVGEYGSATSRVSVSSATIALSAGAVPPLPATAGSMNIFGQDIVSIVASLVPPVLPQFPNSVFIYGDGVPGIAGGVRLSSPSGVQIAGNSDLYATDVYPFTSLGLNLKGRASVPGPAADVTIADCASFAMRNAGTMTGIQSITMAGTGAISDVLTIKPPLASGVGTPNLVISGNPLPLLGFNNFVNIQNAGTIAFDVSGAGTLTGVQQINGVAYPPPIPPNSDWSNFPAVSNVNVSGYNLNNVAQVNGGTSLSLTTATGNITIDPTAVGGTIQMLGDTNVGVVGTPQNLTVTGNARATVDVISSFGGATPYSLNTIGGLVAGTSSRFRDNTEFYVSNDGSDVSGNGSILAPYQTIQKAITQAELISSAALVCCINVASGHYNENLTFNKGYVIVTGSLQSQTGNEVCELTGAISIACVGANDLYNRQVTFQGFNITSAQFQSIIDTSTSSHTVTFQDCKCFMNSQFFVSTATCPDMRLYLTNVEISQTNVANSLPVILTNVGLVELERVDITVDGNCSAIAVTGTSILSRCSLTTLEITSTGATLLPLVSITSTTTATHSFGNVAFAYTSGIAKTNTNALNIASGINTAILMFNCLFTLAGTASSTNNCIGYNGVGSPTIAGINNASLNVNVLLPQTTSVQSGITQIQYTNIQPPGLACYSSTVDQAIAVAGTPQALTYNTTQFNQGTTLVSNSRIYVTAQGNYALSYSVELQHAGAGAVQIATTFLKKNGTTIANTGRQWSITSASFQNAAMAEFVVSLNAGDYVEVFFSGDTSLSANATAAAGALPAIPSVVFNVKQFR